MEQVRVDLATISARFKSAFPNRYDQATMNWGLDARPLRDEMVGDVRRPLFVVLGAVLLLMLIACANIAHLSLARSAARRQEFAVRAALGAGRLRLVRQLLTESLLLGTAAGVIGVGIAMAGTRGLVRLDPGMIPQLDATSVNGTVLAFAVLATFVCAVLVGIVPALRQSMASVHDAIRSGRGGAAQPRRKVRSVLVVAEVAMALVILVGAGLLTRSFLALQKVDQGFTPGPTLTFAVTLPRARYDSAAKMVAFHDQLQARLASIPGVEAVSAMDPLPLGGSSWSWHLPYRRPAIGPGTGSATRRIQCRPSRVCGHVADAAPEGTRVRDHRRTGCATGRDRRRPARHAVLARRRSDREAYQLEW